ncbi:hypothetical protein I0P20_00185 [Salmonella enterica subsp. enterica]|nr:hypothetical protein I0P20_00185 [Salmonella enterica subsp. enterica]
MFKPLIASLMLTSAVVYAKPMPLTAARYAQQLALLQIVGGDKLIIPFC